MINKIKEILTRKLEEVKPSAEELEKLKKETKELVEKLEKAKKSKRIIAQVFVGGSLAKGTIIKKDRYDVDIFVRFDGKYHEISEKLEEILKKARLKAERIHGSRDYFRLQKSSSLQISDSAQKHQFLTLKRKNLFEIIPTIKVSKPEQARNVTDLSYFHVAYVLKEIKKNKRLGDEIMLAKSFCYAQKCYGAESYIKGFSGYALELLVSHYGSFLGFIKKMAEAKGQIVIDPGKYYKNKEEILLNLNEAKLQSPIVFVDPTFKERNALAALSKETFSRFQSSCSKFLKKPSKKFFQLEKINKKRFDFVIEARTNKQEGDIAGSKLLKFFNFFCRNLEKYFRIKESDFEYDGRKTGVYYLKVERKKEIIHSGPEINKVENLLAFRQKHKNVFIKDRKAYSKEKISMNFPEFLNKLKKENKQVMKDMGITRLTII